MSSAQYKISTAHEAEWTGLIIRAEDFGKKVREIMAIKEEWDTYKIANNGKLPADYDERRIAPPRLDNIMITGYNRIMNVNSQSVESTVNGNIAFGSRLETTLDTGADFLGPIFAHFELGIMASAVECWWAPKIGQTMLSEVSFVINSITIDRFTGLYLNSLDEFELDINNETGFFEMIGERVAFIDPMSSQDNLVWRYRGPQYMQLTHPAYTDIYVPLRFHFTREVGFYLPVCAFPFNSLKVIMTIRPLAECWYAAGGAALTTVPTITSASILSEIVCMESMYADRFANSDYEAMFRHAQYSNYSLNAVNYTAKISFISSVFEICGLF